MSNDVNDLRLELRARNNVLYHAIFDHYPTVAAFCRRHHLQQSTVGAWLNLTRSPFRRDADVTLEPIALEALGRTARVLCERLRMDPAVLFPPRLYTGAIPPRQIAEVSSARFGALTEARRLALPPAQDDARFTGELHDALAAVMETLTPRERLVLSELYGLDGKGERTCLEIGREMNITQERVQQIAAKALRKLRRGGRARTLTSFRDGAEHEISDAQIERRQWAAKDLAWLRQREREWEQR